MHKLKVFLKNKYWLTFVIALLVVLCMPMTVKAAAPTADGSITFSYKLAGVEFRLYKVAQMDASGNVVYEDAFKEYTVDLKDSNAAQTLKHFVDRDKIVPTAKATTDDTLSVKFEGLDVEESIYLICGDEKIEGELRYIPTPTIVTLPTEKDGLYYKDIDVINKCETEKVEKKNISVVITWKDLGLESMRPPTITIQLKKDGEVVDEVVLGPENNWSHEWKDLDPNYEWTVVEKVNPPEYGFSIRKEGDTFIIVHDRAPEPTPPASTPTTSTTPSGGTTTTVTPPSELPRTGQLWWPVFALVFGGLLFMVVGLIFKRTERE